MMPVSWNSNGVAVSPPTPSCEVGDVVQGTSLRSTDVEMAVMPQNSLATKVKGKGQVLDIALLHDEHMLIG